MRYVKLVNDYIKNDYEVVGMIGIDGSPTCGVAKTLDLSKFDSLADINPKEIDRIKFNNFIYENLLKEGEGLYTKILREKLERTEIHILFLSHNLIDEMRGIKCEIVLENT